MANNALRDYVSQIERAINCEDGSTISALLSLHDSHVSIIRPYIDNCRDISSMLVGQLSDPYDAIVIAHLQASIAMHKKEWVACYEAQATLVTEFLRIFSQDILWMASPLHTLMRDLRNTGKQADVVLVKEDKKADRLEDAARLLNKIFSLVRPRKSEVGRRWSTLHVVNHLFQIYFLIANLRLCKNLIRAIESPHFPALDVFDISQVVTYQYFVGRLALFDGDYARADSSLTFAFSRCHREAVGNKQRILLYLLPVKLLRGEMPSPLLLRKYYMPQFTSLVTAVRSSSLSALTESLAEHRDFFVKKGLYLLLERLETQIYRGLLKRIYTLLQTPKLKLDDVFRAFVFGSGVVDMTLDEVECILANLIFQGYVKGYISHAPPYLVLSKANPFPPLSQVAAVGSN